MTDEQWQPVPGYEGHYEVSDRGRVRSLDRRVPHPVSGSVRVRGRLLRQNLLQGRPSVPLSKDGQERRVLVHVLVLLAYVGPKPDGLEGCHNDGVYEHNWPSNLRWDTRASNIRDAVAHGVHVNARKTHCPRRHELVPPNLRPSGVNEGKRQCFACHLTRRPARQAATAGRPFDFQAEADARYLAITSR